MTKGLDGPSPDIVVGSDHDQHQVTQFTDMVAPETHDIVSTPSLLASGDMINQGELADFLRRPVLIDESTWTVGTTYASLGLTPWILFFNNPVIKKKVDNYAFINCTLKIKIMINSSPFLYGALVASYEPLITGYGGQISPSVPPDLIDLTQLTTQPHVFITAADSRGGEMSLPFFYHQEWLDLTSADDLTYMGYLRLSEVAQLASANGSVGNTITVQVFAWAEDVKLSGPTLKLAVQSGAVDEYMARPVSNISSTVAAVAEKLSSVPVIGPFAKATVIGARAIGKIGALFGYTNPPVIDDVKPVRIANYHALASAEIGVPADKMTLDPKCELSVDPRTVGLSDVDELSIVYISGREAMLTKVEWATTDSPGVDLFYCAVTPNLINYETNATNGHELGLTPCSIGATMFGNWRGDMIFRFKFISSKYHCGRVRIAWDPIDTLYGGSTFTPAVFSRIVDLSMETDVEVRIPYHQAQRFLALIQPGPTPSYYVKGDTFTSLYNKEYTNGNLVVSIMNSLSAPEATSSIQMLVFVRAADNIEFANPQTQLDTSYSWFAPQSGEEISITGTIPTEEARQYDVYFGEAVRSYRNLLRRAYPTEPLVSSREPIATDELYVVSFSRAIYPPMNGFDPNSQFDASSLGVGANAPCTWAQNTPFQILCPCYKGFRGGFIWHYEAYSKSQVDRRPAIAITYSMKSPRTNSGRVANDDIFAVAAGLSLNSVAQYESVAPYWNRNFANSVDTSGISIMSTSCVEGKSICVPYKANTRFTSTSPSTSKEDDDGYATTAGSVIVNLITYPSRSHGVDAVKDVIIRRYFSVAPDFTFFYFNCVPRLYRYSTTPAGAI